MSWTSSDKALLGAISIVAVGVAGCREPKTTHPPVASPDERPTGPLTLQQAQQYVLALVNRDRQEEGLEPVVWDEVAAEAGQRHAEDMGRRGFTGHWGSDGSVPEQRYTEAGGEDIVQENAACFFDGQKRELDPNPMFEVVELEKVESAFIHETPPNDGHRRNILKPVHNRFGVGLTKAVGIEQPCMAQEFVDDYGTYETLPDQAEPGDTVHVAGQVREPVQFGGVGVARLEPAEPMSFEELKATSVYKMPEPYELYFPEGFKTPKPVQLDGRAFSIDVPLDDSGRSGRYAVSVWGQYPGREDLVMVSLRTILVR